MSDRIENLKKIILDKLNKNQEGLTEKELIKKLNKESRTIRNRLDDLKKEGKVYYEIKQRRKDKRPNKIYFPKKPRKKIPG